MFKKVLVPTDGSDISLSAVAYAVSLAKAFDGVVLAVTLVDPYPFFGAGPDYPHVRDEYLRTANAEAEAALQGARELAQAQGLDITTQVVEAQRTWRGILDVAAREQSDAIVMGSHGRTGLDRLVMGNVTQRVLQHTRLPVLVVHA